MIRYSQALQDIESAIDAEVSGWRAKADARTNLFELLGKYIEETVDAKGRKKQFLPFWSDVKPVYMRLQYNKCIYCETKLEGRKDAYVQWDLEHFRPKGAVSRWPSEKSAYQYDFNTGGETAVGYYLLAYSLYNYAAACKTCNSPFKSSHFPVAAARLFGHRHPESYMDEEAFLIYPLGVGDADPEDLISFVGEEAQPKYQQTQDLSKWRRGRVLIDFFGLNRDGLLANRAAWLRIAVWPNVCEAEKDDLDASKMIARFRSERSQFTNCSKCFLELCRLDRSKAERMIPQFDEIIRRMEE